MTIPTWLRASLITAAQATAAAVLATFGFAAVDWIEGDTVDWVATLGNFRTAVAAVLLPVVVAVHRKVKPPEDTYTGGGDGAP